MCSNKWHQNSSLLYTDIIAEHQIRNQKIYFNETHYIECLSRQLHYKDNIEELALKNLAAINEVYRKWIVVIWNL